MVTIYRVYLTGYKAMYQDYRDATHAVWAQEEWEEAHGPGSAWVTEEAVSQAYAQTLWL